MIHLKWVFFLNFVNNWFSFLLNIKKNLFKKKEIKNDFSNSIFFLNKRDTDFCLEYKEYDTYLSVYKRPNLDGFLKYLKENTEPILYTNGVKSYVDIIMVKLKVKKSDLY